MEYLLAERILRSIRQFREELEVGLAREDEQRVNGRVQLEAERLGDLAEQLLLLMMVKIKRRFEPTTSV